MNDLVLLLGADADLVELFNRFEDHSPGLGLRFDADFVKACGLLASNPGIGPPWRANYRRLLMRRWHIGIFYELVGQRVLIHGIMDVRQDPAWLVRRLGGE